MIPPGLAVGARRVGSGPQMACAEGAEDVLKHAAQIGRAVIGHHARDPSHAMLAKPGRGPSEKQGRRVAALIGQELGIGDAGVIVDSHMEKLPANAPRAVLPAPAAGNAVPEPPNAAELLHIQVQQIAGAGPFVAPHRRRRCEPVQAIQAELALHPHHGGERELQVPSDVETGAVFAPQACDLAARHAAERGRRAVRTTGAIGEARVAPSPIPVHPFPDGAPTHTRVARDLGQRLPAGNPVYDEGSPRGRKPCILVHVHWGLWWLPVEWLRQPQLGTATPQ